MSVQGVTSTPETQHIKNPPPPVAPKQATEGTAVPEDKVTIGSAAQAKQAPATSGDTDHDGK